MQLIDQIKDLTKEIGGTIKEKKGTFIIESVIAERTVFFISKKKLTYSAHLKIDEDTKTIHFSELLKECGFGLSSESGDNSSGFGFKTETYNTLNKARKGTIEEQSTLFGKKYSYKFDYKLIREKIENLAKKAGYKFEYQIMPVK